ncbi:MAG: pitrilysin family protein, partial [Bacteroidota bacterium]
KTENFTLDNGLKVIVVENTKLPRVSFQLFVDVPLHLEKGAAGTSSIAGGLLRTGTSTKTKAEIDAAIDYIGANLSTSGSGIFGSSLSKHKDALLSLMSEILLNPSFPQEEFDKAKTQTLSGLAASKEDPSYIAGNVSSVLRYGKNHPFGEITTEASVENISLDLCKEYYSKYFKPNLSYLVVVGDITAKEAKKDVEKYFSSWKRQDIMATQFDVPQAPEKTKVAFISKTGAVQSEIRVTYPVELKYGTRDQIGVFVLNRILGAGATSRFFQNLREDKGYTYGAYSSISPNKYVASFTASASVRNEVSDSAMIEFLYEMNRIRDEKVDAEEFANAKARIFGTFTRALESPQTIANYALNTARYKMPEDFYATYLQQLESLTADELQQIAKKYIRPENAYLVVVGNKDVTESLKQFDADGDITFYDVYGIKQQQFAAAVPSDMTGMDVIEKYIAAIGGKEKLSGVTDLSMVMEANVQGQVIQIKNQQKTPGKMNMAVSMMGNVMQQTVFDGEQGYSSQMGAKTPMDEATVEATKLQAMPFPELKYAELGVTAELKGVENVDGKRAYEVAISRPDGNNVTDYFDATTFFKIRSVATQEAAGQTMSIITDYATYKDVDGIKFPYVVTVSGAMPFPLKSEVKSVEVNKGLSDDLFKVN